MNYNLGFISDEDIFTHVKNTVEKYRYSIDLSSFNSNLIDPIKLTFDSKIYNQTMKQTQWSLSVFAKLTKQILII